MSDHLVLIIGAGPTGLVLALWLTRLGVRIRIIDSTAEPGTTSRALAVQIFTFGLEKAKFQAARAGVIDQDTFVLLHRAAWLTPIEGQLPT
jgi:2-polyprenyl-6-methoxyphenol hydroxylase-like FAD-dependent oxidoreductase